VACGSVWALLGLAVLAAPAGAQDEPATTAPGIRIALDTGRYDAAHDDFLIQAVEVSGGLREGEEFTVELRGAGDQLLWAATREYTAPSVRIEVDTAVAVTAVTSTDVSQAALPPEVEAVPPQAPAAMEGSGGSGQLTLSMVVTLVVLVVVFRSPLPSAQTSRWTK
jgi:hypothetical protein